MKKKCIWCDGVFSICCFGKNMSICISCAIANKIKYKLQYKYCEKCDKVKHLDCFINADTKRERKHCNDCFTPSSQLKLYYEKSRIDPEGMKIYHREYKRNYRAQKRINEHHN